MVGMYADIYIDFYFSGFSIVCSCSKIKSEKNQPFLFVLEFGFEFHSRVNHVTRACQGVVFHSVAIAKQFMEQTKTNKGLKVTVDNLEPDGT